MESVTFGCSMCCFSTDEYDHFVNHVVRAHRHDPNFIVYCGYPNCPYTTAWGAFKTHSRKHKPEAETVLNIHDAIEVDDEPGTHEDPIHYQLTTDVKKQLYMGKYCLALEADHNMTQRAVDDVLLTTSDLIKQNVDIFRHKVQLALEEQNMPTDFLSNIDSDSFVDLLSTTKRRDKFYIDKYNLLRPEENPKERLVNVVRFIEEQTKFDRGKGTKTESIIQMKEDIPDEEIIRHVDSPKLSPPRLVIFKSDGKIKGQYIVADGCCIDCCSSSGNVAVLELLAVYYIMDLEYPRMYSQLLGILQTHLLQLQPYVGLKCTRYIKFTTELQQMRSTMESKD